MSENNEVQGVKCFEKFENIESIIKNAGDRI